VSFGVSSPVVARAHDAPEANLTPGCLHGCGLCTAYGDLQEFV
jgi:hypothetical protein